MNEFARELKDLLAKYDATISTRTDYTPIGGELETFVVTDGQGNELLAVDESYPAARVINEAFQPRRHNDA